MQEKYTSKSTKETHLIASKLKKELKNVSFNNQAALIILKGDLGSGKTEFAKGFIKSLGIKRSVLSPTFVFVRAYNLIKPFLNFKNIYHYDVYRLIDKPRLKMDDLQDLAFKEIILDSENLVLIEWGKNIIDINQYKYILVSLEVKKQDREITITLK